MTMGRGLVTLYNRGEDLSQAPMQIGDLISVGSYHFRKSYLGVIQTAKSHPEISERLLVNQLSWTNILLRLYKTKEKLAKPISGVRNSKTQRDCHAAAAKRAHGTVTSVAHLPWAARQQLTVGICNRERGYAGTIPMFRFFSSACGLM